MRVLVALAAQRAARMRCAGWLAGWLAGRLYLGRYSCLVVEHSLNLVMILLIMCKSPVIVHFYAVIVLREIVR